MSGKIQITNKKGPVAVVDIEGTIGVPEQWQFDEPGERVATYETFRAAVESLRDLKAQEIVVNIRSTGGNVNDALLIYDALAELGAARITTRCYGYVASAATVIAQAASVGCREISSNSLYLIHRSMCAAEGNSDELSKTLGLLEQTDGRIAAVYAARSGRTVEEFAALMCENSGNGRWLSPEETLAAGLADRIIASAPVVTAVAEKPSPKTGFSKRWNAVIEALGISSQIVPKSDVIANQTVESMAIAQAEIGEAHRLQISELRAQIDILESQNARLNARPTATLSKEDPSHHDTRLTPNEEAYMADAQRFR